MPPTPSVFASILFVLGSFWLQPTPAVAQSEPGRPDDVSSQVTRNYSDAVVAKADAILDASGLRRSGKSIQSTKVSDLSRSISSLTRSRRELKLLIDQWKQAENLVKRNRQQSTALTTQNANLSLQLARVTNTTENNQLVGLINANVARHRLLTEQLTRLREDADAKRGQLSNAEAVYAESVLKIRSDLTELENELATALTSKDVQTALKVMAVNFGVDAAQTPGLILKSASRRLKKIEQEIFSESIPLRVQNRSMYVDVVVDGKTTQMVVDSGASLVSLPEKTAAQLSIIVPDDAPELQLLTADGRSIMGRRVTLSKVRIGQFEAENVDAAVLSETPESAEPLLGMSFLGNFKFEIDIASKTLKMLRVQAE